MSNKILIVDDDAEIRKVIGAHVQHETEKILKAQRINYADL